METYKVSGHILTEQDGCLLPLVKSINKEKVLAGINLKPQGLDCKDCSMENWCDFIRMLLIYIIDKENKK